MQAEGQSKQIFLEFVMNLKESVMLPNSTLCILVSSILLNFSSATLIKNLVWQV